MIGSLRYDIGFSASRSMPAAFARLAVSALLIVAAVVSTGDGARAVEPGKTAMEKDLRTLEVVLDRLLSWSSGDPFTAALFGHNCRGIYIDGYGVLFYANRPMARRAFVDITRFGLNDNRTRSNLNRFGQVTNEPSADKVGEQDEIRDYLNEFYGNYATVLTDLKPEDRVSVMVKIEGPFFAEPTRSIVFSSMEGGDLRRLERARDPVKEAGKRVSFTSVSPDDRDRDKKLYIMAQILAANLETDDITSVYLEGFGAMFLADYGHFPLGFGSSSYEFMEEFQSGEMPRRKGSPGPDSTVSFAQRYRQAIISLRADSTMWKDQTDRVRDSFVDALVKYSRTLEGLKRDDRLGLVVSAQSIYSSGFRGFQVHVDNSDLIAHRRDEIDRDELMKRVVVRYF